MKTLATLLFMGLFSAQLVTSPVAAQSLVIPPPAQAQPIVLKNAYIDPIDGTPIERGAIRFEAGKVVALGVSVDESGALVEDLKGLHLYPGLIDANSSVGLFEVESVRGTVDTAEVGPFNPNVRADRAVNPDSEQLTVTRANGVLASLVVPQPGAAGVVTGSSALLQMDGWTVEQMTVKAPLAMHIHWPSSNLPTWLPAPIRDAALAATKANLEQLEALFVDAKSYAGLSKSVQLERENLRLASLQPALEKTVPVFFHVREQQQIRAALKFAGRHDLRAVLVGAQDAWRVLELIKAANVPVIVGGTLVDPLRRDDAYDAIYRNPLALSQAGIPFAIALPGDTFSSTQARNLPYHAAMAAAFGLEPREALKAITLYPAQILGVADQLGSLKVGSRATFFLSNGDPLDVRTQVTRAFISGREISLKNRQTELNTKYSEKYQQK